MDRPGAQDGLSVMTGLSDLSSFYANRPSSVFVGGKWIRGRGRKPLLAIDPSSGQTFGEAGSGCEADVDEAVRAAAVAFESWRWLGPRDRAQYLRGIASGLGKRREHLVQLQMLNNGKPRAEAEIDVADAMATFEYYATLAEGLEDTQGKTVTLPDTGMSGCTYFEPFGPVALIVPWNFPLVTTAWKLAPALAAGCTAVLKPSEFTTLAELVYGDIALEIELPLGVLNIVPGDGVVGAALAAHPHIRKVSFTGSNSTGARVMSAAAMRCVPVSLELGGKSPIVVLDDADVDQAVSIAANGIFWNCGQMCSATSRMIVSDTIADELIEKLRAKTNGLTVGGPMGSTAEMGPATTAQQRAKVLQFLIDGEKDRLDCIAGGLNREFGGDGFFVPPTLFLDVPVSHPIWRDEIFGPVMAIKRVSNEEEAVAAANDTEFGLAATVLGGDENRAAKVARKIDAGHVWINSPQVIFPETAWGGFKASGIGRELGPWGLAAYSTVKHVTQAR